MSAQPQLLLTLCISPESRGSSTKSGEKAPQGHRLGCKKDEAEAAALHFCLPFPSLNCRSGEGHKNSTAGEGRERTWHNLSHFPLMGFLVRHEAQKGGAALIPCNFRSALFLGLE